MATLFSDLFSEFVENRIRDAKLAERYTPDILSSVLASWLKTARELFRDLSIENPNFTTNKMEDVVESTLQMYRYSFTGTSDSRNLDPQPTENSSFYVTLNGVVLSADKYYYNEITNQMIIQDVPNQLNNIYIGAYTDGQFNQTLNLTERGIVLDIMQMNYIDLQVANEKTINQRVYGKDYGMYSQANHLTTLNDTIDMKYKRIIQKMNLYSYRQDPEELTKLGGKQ